MRLSDVDELLLSALQIDELTATERIRALRNELAHAAVLLSFARNVLSVDVGVLQRVMGEPGDLQPTVDDLPEILASASIGGGWSLSSDSPSAMASAESALRGEAEDLMSAHGRIALIDVNRPESVRRALDDIQGQLGVVAERRESVERRFRELQAAIVGRYKSGDAAVDDWLD
jgi:hypothetical protein